MSNVTVWGRCSFVLVGGLALGLSGLTGCGSSGSGGSSGGGVTVSGALAPGGAATIYVIQAGASGDSVLAFAADSSQNATPIATLNIPAAIEVGAVATDSAGQIYVGGLQSNGSVTLTGEILVYAAGATGNATPLRTIFPQSGTISFVDPIGMTVDSAGQIYVMSAPGNIFVFASGANGAATPTRQIELAEFSSIGQIAVDAAGEIFVTAITTGEAGDDSYKGVILVFAAGESGSDAPARTISAPAATATVNNAFVGIAVDGAGNVYTTFDTETHDSTNDVTGTTATVEEFAAGASGLVTATKTISGTATGLTVGEGLSLDGAGNLYLVNVAGTLTPTPMYSVLGFGPNASGSVAPGLSLSSSSWTDGLVGLAVK